MSGLSIARALVELKTLDSRINKIIGESSFIVCKTKNKNYQYNEVDFKKSAESSYQSLNDLIIRREKIKSAIVISNAKTEVEIAGRKMTVSQAIDFKNTIQYKRTILDTLKRQKQYAIVESESHRQRVQQKIDENIKIVCGKDNKPDAVTIQTITESISKNDPVEVFDPLGLDKVIKDLETEIENFSANVDYVLSESNALTQIMV
jgi:hypothetical protein